MSASWRGRAGVAAGMGLFFVAQACSSLNRAGPDVTCEDLDFGTVNACEDGIIASCDDGKMVTYRVCGGDPDGTSAKDICGEEWQQAGAFRCSSGEPVPGE